MQIFLTSSVMKKSEVKEILAAALEQFYTPVPICLREPELNLHELQLINIVFTKRKKARVDTDLQDMDIAEMGNIDLEYNTEIVSDEEEDFSTLKQNVQYLRSTIRPTKKKCHEKVPRFRN